MELETIKALKEILQTVGFPTLVACWLLMRTDKRLDAMLEAINRIERNQ